MKYIELTHLDIGKIFVNFDKIVMFYEANDKTTSLSWDGSKIFKVTESVEEINAKLNANKGVL